MTNQATPPAMPEYQEGKITLWRNGKWLSVDLSEMDQIIEEDNRVVDNSSDVPAGE